MMKKLPLLLLAAVVSFEVFAKESLDSLPCYCIDLIELMGGNDETELSEEDVKALEKDNIYYSERKDCLAKFLVPVKQGKKTSSSKEYTREELIKEGFEAEKAFEGYEYPEQELKDYYLNNQDAATRMRDMVASEKEINDAPYYRGRLKLKTWKIKDEWTEEFRSCQVADIKPCNFPITVHIDKNGKGRLECTEDAPALAKYFCKYASKKGSPCFYPVKLEFRKIKESTNVNVKGTINVREQRIFEETAEVKIAHKDGQWKLVKSPDNWDKIPLQNYIRSLQLENKTKKSKLTLNVQIIKRYMEVGYLGTCQLAPIYQITSANDKKLQFETYDESDMLKDVYVRIDAMPEYPGGEQAMYQFLSDYVIYPDSAKNNGIEGRVVCQFVVDKDGSLTDIEVIHSSGDASLDEEAVRVIGLMPKWKPGKALNKPARTKMTLPINFKFK